jgi:hypothetical protein
MERVASTIYFDFLYPHRNRATCSRPRAGRRYDDYVFIADIELINSPAEKIGSAH